MLLILQFMIAADVTAAQPDAWGRALNIILDEGMTGVMLIAAWVIFRDKLTELIRACNRSSRLCVMVMEGLEHKSEVLKTIIDELKEEITQSEQKHGK